MEVVQEGCLEQEKTITTKVGATHYRTGLFRTQIRGTITVAGSAGVQRCLQSLYCLAGSTVD